MLSTTYNGSKRHTSVPLCSKLLVGKNRVMRLLVLGCALAVLTLSAIAQQPPQDPAEVERYIKDRRIRAETEGHHGKVAVEIHRGRC